MTGIPADELLSMAYETRVLVLFENDNQDGFKQVLLTPKQFKCVSDAIVRGATKEPSTRPGNEVVEIVLGDRIIPPELFEGMDSISDV